MADNLENHQECKRRMWQKLIEWSEARSSSRARLPEPLVVSKADQEELLLILLEYANAAIKPWLASSEGRIVRTRFRPELVLEIFACAFLNLWTKVTSHVRFENTGALPFGWEVSRANLLLHQDDRGESYRTALNKAIEKHMVTLFRPFAEMVDTSEVEGAPPAPHRFGSAADDHWDSGECVTGDEEFEPTPAERALHGAAAVREEPAPAQAKTIHATRTIGALDRFVYSLYNETPRLTQKDMCVRIDKAKFQSPWPGLTFMEKYREDPGRVRSWLSKAKKLVSASGNSGN